MILLKNILNIKEKLRFKKQHITTEKFIFLQNKIGASMKCWSMIFTYQKNVNK